MRHRTGERDVGFETECPDVVVKRVPLPTVNLTDHHDADLMIAFGKEGREPLSIRLKAS